MAITIQKSSSGAYFTIQNPSDTARPYPANDYVPIPYSDGTFTLVNKHDEAYLRDGYPSNPKTCLIYRQLYSNIINGDTGSPFIDLPTLLSYVETNFFHNPGGNAGSTSQTGTALSFTSDAIYGNTTTPETGNITAILTGAKLGISVLLLHNNGTTPTFSSEFKKLSSSGSYVTGVLNYIDCQYIDDTHIRYSISQ